VSLHTSLAGVTTIKELSLKALITLYTKGLYCLDSSTQYFVQANVMQKSVLCWHHGTDEMLKDVNQETS
jgi:hypothetical protein